jgi:hypothetical protein
MPLPLNFITFSMTYEGNAKHHRHALFGKHAGEGNAKFLSQEKPKLNLWNFNSNRISQNLLVLASKIRR